MSDREVAGEVFSIQLCPGRRQSMRRVDQARAHKDFGLEGDSHARANSRRQVLLIEHETLTELDISVTAVKENITTRGINLMKLSPGQQLQLGEVVRLELTAPCDPCSRMDEIRPGLREELDGRRGVLAKVIIGGVFSVGDPICVVSPAMDATLHGDLNNCRSESR